MSDQPPSTGDADEPESEPRRPRHETQAERRASETVMLNSDNLGDMVSEAKAGAAAPGQARPSIGGPAGAELLPEQAERRNVILIAGVALLIVLAGIIAYLIYIAD
jgi:hypothetical protein